MLGYSKLEYEIFAFPAKPYNLSNPKIELISEIIPVNRISSGQWKDIKKLQGSLSVTYLRWKYSSSETKVLLAYTNENLAYIHWIVPDSKISKRYPFINKNSYAIISCLTANDYRGLSIYPSQLQKTLSHENFNKLFWIWCTRENIASKKGIIKAGAKHKGVFIQTKFLFGILNSIKYNFCDDNHE